MSAGIMPLEYVFADEVPSAVSDENGGGEKEEGGTKAGSETKNSEKADVKEYDAKAPEEKGGQTEKPEEKTPEERVPEEKETENTEPEEKTGASETPSEESGENTETEPAEQPSETPSGTPGMLLSKSGVVKHFGPNSKKSIQKVHQSYPQATSSASYVPSNSWTTARAMLSRRRSYPRSRSSGPRCSWG